MYRKMFIWRNVTVSVQELHPPPKSDVRRYRQGNSHFLGIDLKQAIFPILSSHNIFILVKRDVDSDTVLADTQKQ